MRRLDKFETLGEGSKYFEGQSFPCHCYRVDTCAATRFRNKSGLHDQKERYAYQQDECEFDESRLFQSYQEGSGM